MSPCFYYIPTNEFGKASCRKTSMFSRIRPENCVEKPLFYYQGQARKTPAPPRIGAPPNRGEGVTIPSRPAQTLRRAPPFSPGRPYFPIRILPGSSFQLSAVAFCRAGAFLPPPAPPWPQPPPSPVLILRFRENLFPEGFFCPAAPRCEGPKRHRF